MKTVITNLWSNEAMLPAGGAEKYSATIDMLRLTGNASILVVTSAGSLALSYQVSDDGTNWYSPEDTSGTALNVINAAVTAGSNWIVFNPTMGRYLRIVVVLSGVNSTVSIDLHHSEEI